MRCLRTALAVVILGASFGVACGGTATAQQDSHFPLASRADALLSLKDMLAMELAVYDRSDITIAGKRCHRAPAVGNHGWRCQFRRATASNYDTVYQNGRGVLFIKGSQVRWRFRVTASCTGDCGGTSGPSVHRITWRGGIEAF